jgi:hypothetical protein
MDRREQMRIAYDTDAFNRLPSFQAAREAVKYRRFDLPKLGEVICHHGLEDSLGISLLHKHFPIFETECMVKRCTSKGASIFPSDTDEGLVPYSWNLLVNPADEDDFLWQPLEFLSNTPENFHAIKKARKAQKHIKCLEDLATRLQSLSLETVFGISALPGASIEVGQGETLLELTNEEKRSLSITCVPEIDLPAGTDETLWVFKALPKRDDGRATQGCGAHCYSHCIGHGGKRQDIL